MKKNYPLYFCSSSFHLYPAKKHNKLIISLQQFILSVHNILRILNFAVMYNKNECREMDSVVKNST